MVKRFLSIILTILTMSVLLIVAPVCGLAANAAELPAFSGGSGTEDNPYKISSAADLKALAVAVNDGAECKGIYFQLTKDIDLGGSPWTPIGSFDNQFTGIFDGNGCKITRLTINTTANNQGLFGYVGGGTVKKLGVVGTVTGKDYVGGIVGVNFGGTIEDCYNACTVTGNNKYVGGVVGYNFHGTVKNCYNVGTISGNEYVGGVVGDTQNESDIQSCYNTGTVNNTASSNFGGVVGNDEDSSIDDTWDFAGSGSEKPTDGNVWTKSDWSKHPVLKDNHFTVTFDPNYDGASEDQKHKYDVDYGTTYGDLPSDPTRDGYTFDGWYTEKADGDKVNTEGKTITESQTIYAQWTLEKYNIEYVLGDGGENNANNPESYTIEDTPITLADPTRKGYDFVGWYEVDPQTGDDIGTEKATGIPKDSTGDKKFRAEWTLSTYTITYEKNGGEFTNGSPRTSYQYGDSFPLPTANDITKTGYTFVSWHTSSSLTDSTKVTEITSTDTGNKTFYAKWEANTCRVNLEYDGADGGNSNTFIEVTFDSTYNNLPTPTKKGYDFDGWYTEVNGGSKVTKDTKVTTDEPHTLYAHWTKATYTVTYEKNGGTIENEKNYQSYQYGQSIVLPTPTKTGFTFDGWYTDRNFASSTKVDAITENDAEDKTFYAKWTAIAYKVTYYITDKDGKTKEYTFDPVYTTYTYDKSLTLPDPTKVTLPTVGYTLDGWYTKSSFTDTPTTTIAANKYTSDFDLYAKWVPAKFRVSFETNGGTFTGRSIIEEQYEYGTGMETLPKVEREGYTFGGWYEESDFSGVEVKAISEEATGDIKLYAKWTANTYKVTFDPKGGEISVTEKEVTYDQKYGDLPELSITGHTFSGWFTEDNVRITSESVVKTADNHTLYAHLDECDHEGYVTLKDDKNGKTHSGTCTNCNKHVTDDHNWDIVTTKEATETDKGEKTYTCTVCGAEKTEVLPATGNNPSQPSSGGNSTPSTGGDTEPSGGNGAGGVNIDFASGKNAPAISLNKSNINKLKKEVIANHLTPEEKTAIENGTVIDIILSVELVKDGEAIEDKQAVEAALTDSGYVVGMHLNIEMIKMIDGKQVGKITELSSPIRVIVDVPEELQNEDREFEVVRVHNGEAAILEDADKKQDTVTIVTDKFSTYSIVYRDIMAYNPDTGLTTPIAIITLAGAVIVTAISVKKKKMN